MRSLMFLLCLVASLTGTSLRQAEKANDLARSLDELGGRDVIELVDGGIGDDAGETVVDSDDGRELPRIFDLPLPDGLLPPLLPDSPPAGFISERPGDRSAPFPACSSRRQAWLQCFLF